MKPDETNQLLITSLLCNYLLLFKECEILEKTLPDGSHKRFSRRIISSALPGGERDNDPPALWEEVEIDESNPDDEKFDADVSFCFSLLVLCGYNFIFLSVNTVSVFLGILRK